MAVKIVMPSLGMYTIEGELTRWLVDEGAEVKEGQQILELTTEKTTVEIESPAAGVLHRVVTEGTQTRVEDLLGYVLASGESPPAAPAHVPPSSPRTQPIAHQRVIPSSPRSSLRATDPFSGPRPSRE